MRTPRTLLKIVRPSLLTWLAFGATLAIVVGSAAFLYQSYPSLPDVLPVRFNVRSRPIGWQYKTYARLLMPAVVEGALVLVLGAIGALILWRSHGDGDDAAPDIVAASTAAEAIALIAFVWVAFQAYAAAALVQMWQRGRGGLGEWYPWIVFAGIALSIAAGYRAHRRLGRPAPREFVAEHWRLGHLYNNRSDPALFVPTRDGSRWTLNFGRPVAAALLGIAVLVGVIAPTVILGLMLR